MHRQIKFIIIISILSVTNLFSQEKEDIGTEVVNVVKPYAPSVSDAFKVKEIPSLNDSVTAAKKEINYSIFSVPVASTFTPAQGRATGLPRAKKEKLYNSSVSLGAGNYGNILLDFYTSRELNRDETLDINLNHHSSQGGIDGVQLDDKFYDTKLEAAYKKKDRYMSWGVNGGVQHQIYNWYGIPQGLLEITISEIDSKQSYYNIFAGADLDIEDSFFTGGTIKLNRFSDRFDSAENRAVLTPKVEIPVGEGFINIDFRVDYLSGKFERNYFSNEALKYQNLIVGGSPSYTFLRDDFTVNVGASVFYLLDIEDGENNGVFVYPNISASYRLIDEYAIIYAGVDGDLEQNTYNGFHADNQFVSPTLAIVPTDKQYDAYGGVKGRFLPNVGYNVRASYKSEKNKALYQLNISESPLNTEGYSFGNSFGVLYDDVTTISLFGEVNIDINRNFVLRANAEVFDYSLDNEEEAWNLPSLKASLFADFNLDNKFFAGANLFFVGERKDLFINESIFIEPVELTLESYFDLNAHIGYHFTEQFSAYVKANNITSNEYTSWVNYPVQGFQVLGGLTYKFDF